MDVLYISAKIQIPLQEIQFSFARSSGPGGQNVNKVNSKAILRWNYLRLPLTVQERLQKYSSRLTKEGDILLTCDEFRDQKKNQETCLEKLRQLLLAVAHEPKVRKKTKPTKASQRKRKEQKRKQGEKKKQRARPTY